MRLIRAVGNLVFTGPGWMAPLAVLPDALDDVPVVTADVRVPGASVMVSFFAWAVTAAAVAAAAALLGGIALD